MAQRIVPFRGLRALLVTTLGLVILLLTIGLTLAPPVLAGDAFFQGTGEYGTSRPVITRPSAPRTIAW